MTSEMTMHLNVYSKCRMLVPLRKNIVDDRAVLGQLIAHPQVV